MSPATVYAAPRFAPLPGERRQFRNWVKVIDQLRAKPGEWAAVATQDCGRHPYNRAQKARYGIDIVTRSNGDGTWTVWMRSVAPVRVEPNVAPESAPAFRPAPVQPPVTPSMFRHVAVDRRCL